jgi:hypothetical protein
MGGWVVGGAEHLRNVRSSSRWYRILISSLAQLAAKGHCVGAPLVGGKVQASSVRSSSRWYRIDFPCWHSQLQMDTACLSGRVLPVCGGVLEFSEWRSVKCWCGSV